MNKWKKYTQFILSIILLLSIAGCSKKNNEMVKEERKESIEGDQVTMSWWGGESRTIATINALLSFQEKTGAIIEEDYGSWTGWEEKIMKEFDSNTNKDINQIQFYWGETLGANTFVDLNEYYDIIDLNQFPESALSQLTIDGKLIALPVSITGRIFFWNKKLFDSAGISIPSSNEELLQAGKIFKETLGDEYYPLYINEYDRMILMVYYLESVYGKTWVVNEQLNYTKEEILKGFEYIESLEKNHVIPSINQMIDEVDNVNGVNKGWNDGIYGGVWAWDSTATKYRDALKDSFYFEVGDYFDDWGPYQGGYKKISTAFAISSSCENKQAAAMLLEYILNGEGVKELGVERGIPCSKKALDIIQQDNAIDEKVIEANHKMAEWTSFGLDKNFEVAALKGTTTGVYYVTFATLSQNGYSSEIKEEMAQYLIDGINGTYK